MGDGLPPDKRIDWIRERVIILCKAKADLFDKMLQTEEGELVRKFVSDESTNRIFFVAGAKDMTVTEKMPDEKQTKKKAVYALKTKECKFDEKKMDEMMDNCVVGDLSPQILQNFYNMMRAVYLPILKNPKNTVGFPEVVMKAVQERYNSMLASLYTAVGQTQGKTYLWLPAINQASADDKNLKESDKDRVHVLESAVVMWTDRINIVRHAAWHAAPARAAARPMLC